MPCSYKLISNSKPNDKCKLEDIRVGDQIIHSWECDKGMINVIIFLNVKCTHCAK